MVLPEADLGGLTLNNDVGITHWIGVPSTTRGWGERKSSKTGVEAVYAGRHLNAAAAVR